ncbi:hypothetical protein [Longimicrobium sp.]|uniref:hypothetical protein n=1 Tax=Longimicrobium sp. TaxID=2029185 RepID=UPI003B3BE837
MEPPQRIRKLISDDNPNDPDGLRALMEKLSPQEDGAEQRLIPLMRDAVMDRAERTSLRNAAREIGMSPSGLQKFLEGGMPYTKTIHRLRLWYLQHAGNAGNSITHDEALAALRVLVHDLPPSTRAETMEAMAGCVGQGYVRIRRAVPAWVAEIRDGRDR